MLGGIFCSKNSLSEDNYASFFPLFVYMVLRNKKKKDKLSFADSVSLTIGAWFFKELSYWTLFDHGRSHCPHMIYIALEKTV